jgi:hypothetical protein
VERPGYPRVVFKTIRRRAATEATSKLGAGRILAEEDGANFFGLGSKGGAQIRGNGFLGVSQEALLFVMWFPRKEIRIPRDRIVSVERANSHAGKTIGRPLLRVRFRNDVGEEDTAAWYVSDLQRWLVLLGAAPI